jgi:hypothetical protein
VIALLPGADSRSPLRALDNPEFNFLVGRYLGQLAWERCYYEAVDDDDHQALHTIALRLDSVTGQHLSADPDDQVASEFLPRLAAEVTRNLSKQHTQMAERFRGELGSRLSAYGKAQVDPFESMFAEVHRRVRCCYGRDGPDLRCLVALDAAGKPHDLASLIHVGGGAEARSQSRVDVRVALSAARLGSTEWRTMSYALAHCHRRRLR